MSVTLTQRLTKLAIVTPSMDPQAQTPDPQMAMAQQALAQGGQPQGQPPVDPATGQPMDPSAAAAGGAPPPGAAPPGAAPPPGGAPPPAPGYDPIACSVADPSSQQGMMCALQAQAAGAAPPGAAPPGGPPPGGGAPPPGADPTKMAALRASMDAWGLSKQALGAGLAAGGGMPPAAPMAGGRAPAPPPMSAAGGAASPAFRGLATMPGGIFGALRGGPGAAAPPPATAAAPAAGLGATTMGTTGGLAKAGNLRLPGSSPANVYAGATPGDPAPRPGARLPAATDARVSTPWPGMPATTDRGPVPLANRVKQAQLPALAIADLAPLVVGGAETASDTMGQAINNPDHPWTSAGRALISGLGSTAGMMGGGYAGKNFGPWGPLAGMGLGAIGGGLGGAGLARYLIPEAKKEDKDRDREKAGADRSTHPSTLPQATPGRVKVGNADRLVGSPMGAMAAGMTNLPRPDQQALLNNPGVLAPKNTQTVKPPLPPQPNMALGGPRMPQGALGSFMGSGTGLGNLWGPRELRGGLSGPGGEMAAVKSSAFVKRALGGLDLGGRMGFEVDPATGAGLGGLGGLAAAAGLVPAGMTLGGLGGGLVGLGRGNAPEGLGRGIVRGGMTAGGLGLGGGLGAGLGGALGGPTGAGLGGALGAGIGGLGGWRLAGGLMGRPSGAAKPPLPAHPKDESEEPEDREKKAALDEEFYHTKFPLYASHRRNGLSVQEAWHRANADAAEERRKQARANHIGDTVLGGLTGAMPGMLAGGYLGGPIGAGLGALGGAGLGAGAGYLLGRPKEAAFGYGDPDEVKHHYTLGHAEDPGQIYHLRPGPEDLGMDFYNAKPTAWNRLTEPLYLPHQFRAALATARGMPNTPMIRSTVREGPQAEWEAEKEFPESAWEEGPGGMQMAMRSKDAPRPTGPDYATARLQALAGLEPTGLHEPAKKKGKTKAAALDGYSTDDSDEPSPHNRNRVRDKREGEDAEGRTFRPPSPNIALPPQPHRLSEGHMASLVRRLQHLGQGGDCAKMAAEMKVEDAGGGPDIPANDETSPTGAASPPQNPQSGGGGGGDKPPGPEEVHLRDAISPAQACAGCGNFDGQACQLLQMPVQPTQTCDAFAPGPAMAGISPQGVMADAMAAPPIGKAAGMRPSPFGRRTHEKRANSPLYAGSVTGAPTLPPVGGSPPAIASSAAGSMTGQPAAAPIPPMPPPSWLDKRRTFHEGEGWKMAAVSDYVPQDLLARMQSMGGQAWQHVGEHPYAYGGALGALGLGLGAAGLYGSGAVPVPRLSPADRRRRMQAMIEAEATGKQAMVKSGITHAIGALIGGPVGAAMAPHGHRGEGALRGLITGHRMGLLGGLGGLGGGLLGSAGGPIGTGLGAGVGGGLGAWGGHAWAQHRMGKPSWERGPGHGDVPPPHQAKGHGKKHEPRKHGPPAHKPKAPHRPGAHHKKAGLDKAAYEPRPYSWVGPGIVGAGIGTAHAMNDPSWTKMTPREQAIATSGLMGTSAGFLGGGLAGEQLAHMLPEGYRGWGGVGGALAGTLGGAGLGMGLGHLMAGPEPAKGKHKDEDHEKEGHYPGCKSSRRTQARQHARKQRRMRRKHASAELVDSLLGVVKRAAALKCGCGCATCVACGTKQAQGEIQKVRVRRPESRTNKGQFSWRGRGSQDLRDDPMYDHFGTKAGSLGAQAAALALSLPASR